MPSPTNVRGEGAARAARPRTSSSIVSATPGAYICKKTGNAQRSVASRIRETSDEWGGQYTHVWINRVILGRTDAPCADLVDRAFRPRSAQQALLVVIRCIPTVVVLSGASRD